MAETKKAKKGGKRPGAGRPSGALNTATLERNKVLEGMRQRIMGRADRLLDKQFILTEGLQYLYKIEKEWVDLGTDKKGNKKGYWKNKRPKLVEAEWEIRAYLENVVDKANGDVEDDTDPGATYYFITVERPSQSSIDSAFNRTFGNTAQPITGEGGEGPVEVTVIKYANEKKP